MVLKLEFKRSTIFTYRINYVAAAVIDSYVQRFCKVPLSGTQFSRHLNKTKTSARKHTETPRPDGDFSSRVKNQKVKI